MNKFRMLLIMIIFSTNSNASEWLISVDIINNLGDKYNYSFVKNEKDIYVNEIKKPFSHLITNKELWRNLIDLKTSFNQECINGQMKIVRKIDQAPKEIIISCLDHPKTLHLLNLIELEQLSL